MKIATRYTWLMVGVVATCLLGLIIVAYLNLLDEILEVFAADLPPVDTRVMETNLEISWDINREDVIIQQVAWLQERTEAVTIMFSTISEPREQLRFEILVSNNGDEIVQVEYIKLTMFDTNGIESEVGRYDMYSQHKNGGPSQLFPGETRPIWAGSVLFPADILSPVNWSSVHIKISFVTSQEEPLCQVKHWSGDRVLVRNAGYKWLSNRYEFSGRVNEVFPFSGQLLYSRPRVVVSFYGSNEGFIFGSKIWLQNNNTFEVEKGTIETKEIGSFQIHFIEAFSGGVDCP